MSGARVQPERANIVVCCEHCYKVVKQRCTTADQAEKFPRFAERMTEIKVIARDGPLTRLRKANQKK